MAMESRTRNSGGDGITEIKLFVLPVIPTLMTLVVLTESGVCAGSCV